MEDRDFLPEFCSKETLVLCCGNQLFGDDGFGPAVAEHLLKYYNIPSNVYVADVGTGIRRLLFTLLVSPRLPRTMILVDAVDQGHRPGEIFEISLDEVPLEKADDFSLHQVPSSNLARNLQDAGVDIHVKVCQVERIPDCVEPGLTKTLMDAVPQMCDLIAQEYLIPYTAPTTSGCNIPPSQSSAL